MLEIASFHAPMSAGSEAGTRNKPAVTQPKPHSVPHLTTGSGAMPSCSLWGNLELGGRLFPIKKKSPRVALEGP